MKYLVGEKYHRLTIIEEIGKNRHGNRIVKCKCDCGNELNVQATNLKKGVKSCGCFRKEVSTVRQIKHGLSKTTEYAIWSQMIQRCTNPNYIEFYNYGGKGITVCKEWMDSFEVFLHDVGRRPSASHSLDRINGFKGYSKSNIRWATQSEQCRNKPKKKGCTSRYRGVHWDKEYQKWRVCIIIDGKKCYLGRYCDEDEAYKVYVHSYIKNYGCRPPYENY